MLAPLLKPLHSAPAAWSSPALDLRFDLGEIDAGITFARPSTAMRWGPLGLLESVAVGTPVIDYAPATLQTSTTALTVGLGTQILAVSGAGFPPGTPVRITRTSDPATWMAGVVLWNRTGSLRVAVLRSAGAGSYSGWSVIECRGLRVEEQRTNLLTYSEQLWDTTKWGVGSTLGNFFTVTQSTDVTDIYGAAGSVAKFVAAATTSVLFLRKTGLTLSSGTTYSPTIAVYVPTQAGVTSWTIFTDYQDADTSSDATSTTFDKWVFVSVPPKALTGAWNFVDFNIRTNGGTPSTGFTFYAMAADLQAGAFPTSYTPTTSAAVTRSADVASMTGTNFSAWYNQSEGTFIIHGDIPSPTANYSQIFLSWSDGTSNNREYVGKKYDSVTACEFGLTEGGAGQAFILSSPPSMQDVRLALGYRVNDFALVTNGGALASDTSGAVPASNRLDIGYLNPGGGSQYLNGHIRRLRYYPKRLSNSALQRLSA